MNAEDARKLSDKWLDDSLLGEASIDEAIAIAASKGRTAVQRSLRETDGRLRDKAFARVKEIFEKKGFTVVRTKWSGDSRDPKGYDMAVVSW